VINIRFAAPKTKFRRSHCAQSHVIIFFTAPKNKSQAQRQKS
jgi:hypothetical protein